VFCSASNSAHTLPFIYRLKQPLVVNCLALQNNKTEYLSVVTLCTNPPQFFNGVGPTPDEAGDSAAVDALRKLSEVGLEDLCGPSQAEASPGLVANLIQCYC